MSLREEIDAWREVLNEPPFEPLPEARQYPGKNEFQLAEALLILRRRQRKTQSEVAEDLGLSPRTIWDFEQGVKPESAFSARVRGLVETWILRNGGSVG